MVTLIGLILCRPQIQVYLYSASEKLMGFILVFVNPICLSYEQCQ